MFDDIIATMAARYGVPPAWIYAVIEVESAFDPNAYRAEPKISDASYGLMQLLSRTARGLGFEGDVSGLFEPAVNIELGTKLLGQLRASYGDDFQRVYSAYNSGNPDKWETSSEVAAHVARAVSALQHWVGNIAGEVAANPAGSGVAALVALVLLWAWVKPKRK